MAEIIPFAKGSPTPELSPLEKTQRSMAAELAVNKILASYLDYGKFSPEYLATLMTAVASYPVEVITQLPDLRTGIPARCPTYPPNVGQIVEYGDLLEKQLAAMRAPAAKPSRFPDYSKRRTFSMAEYHAERCGVDIGVGARFRPFPKLWEEFGDEFMGFPDFDQAMAASRALAVEGRDAALAVLEGRHRGQKSETPKPAGEPYRPLPPRGQPANVVASEAL